MCQEDREGRKRRVTRRRVSHIPGLMHGAIDSSLLPAPSLHFKESMEAGRRGRRDGGRRGGVYECVCVKKGGGRVALNSWVDVNKAVTVWMVILSCYLCSLLSLSLQPPSSLATSGQHLLSSFTSPRPPSLCNPPPLPGSLGAIKHLTGGILQLALVSNQWTHTSIFKHIKSTHAVDQTNDSYSGSSSKLGKKKESLKEA